MARNPDLISQALSQTRLFSALPEEALQELVPLFVERSFQKEELIFRQGDTGEALLVLSEGQVRVEREIVDGSRVTLALRGPGSVLGEMALLDGSERSASVYALEACEGLTLARSSFFRHLQAHPESYQALLAILCRRLRESDQKVEDLGSKSLVERLAGTLLQLAASEGRATEQGVELSSMVTYQLLTGLLCTNRESVSRGIRDLRAKSLLEKSGRRFVLTDVQGLSDLYEFSESL